MKLFEKVALPFPGAGCQQTGYSDTPGASSGLGLPCLWKGLWELFRSAELSAFISKSPNLPWVIDGSSK